MAEQRLKRRVEEVANRLQRLRRLYTRTRNWLIIALGGLLLLAANALLPTPLLSPPAAIGAGLFLLIVGGLLSLQAHASAHDVARTIEQRYPDLDSRLVTALSQRPDMDVGGFSFLQQEVISQALLHAQRHDWQDAVPARSIVAARLWQSAALALLVASFVGAAAAGRRPANTGTTHLADTADVSTEDRYQVQIEPGDVERERGTALLVLARFGGTLPQEVTLVTNAADGTRQEIPLSRSLDDPLFGGRLASLSTDLTYHVRYDEHLTDSYRVRVFDYPQLLQADARIEYPEYTGLAIKKLEDVRRVSVVEGSQLTLTCTLNKPVTSARLIDDERKELILTADPATPETVRVTWTPQTRRTWTLELIDEAQRHNQQPPQIVVDVIPNQRPDLKVAFPARDLRVSPLQELPLEALVSDDFGLTEYGVVYQLPERDEQTLKLGDRSDHDIPVDVTHELSFESFQAQPNELVAYYFYADDIGPQGESRRTMSNMYFAEVRHFDEVFRQSSSSGGDGRQQQQGQGSPAAELLQLQREIVTATWNLVRREQGAPSTTLPADAGVVADSQAQALQAAGKLHSQVEDALSRQYLAEAMRQMQRGEQQLRSAADTPSASPLVEARRSTQSAYGFLLKLQAREHLVQQSQNSPSSSSSSGQQQQLAQQLQQLELKNDRNRYESEQQAELPADREAMQVLNRLRELARRQGDLNEKIKELENALRNAQSEQEREEIQRQLKRLQEEQQQLMRDLDETRQRMEQPQNRSQMADARQQAEQTREHLRQTTEALEAGQISKAVAEGTRAQRELESLKEQFRNQAAGQFQEQMRQLREQARELAETEQELADRLTPQNSTRAQPPADGRPRLQQETDDGASLEEAFAEQNQKLSELMQQAEEIVRQSETSEPLLSKKLYDAIRKTRVDQPQQSLTMTRQFLRLGLDREAAQAEQQARRGIDTLRQGVEQAASSILGNEAESLERARQELDDLARAIGSEMAQADPQQQESSRQPPSGQSSTDRPSSKAELPTPATDDPAANQEAADHPAQRQGERTQTEAASSDGQPDDDSASSTGQRSSQQQSLRGEPRSGQERPSGESLLQSTTDSPQTSASSESSSRQPGRQRPNDSDNPLSTFLRQQDANDGGGGAAGHRWGPQRPLTSSEFIEWSDRMRDVEEMLDDPGLRAEVAQIRDRARQMRIDVKRHSRQPDWQLVRTSIYGPMLELQDRLHEELARLDPDREEIVPLDRDPVPDRYDELVRKYYERLGSGR